MGTTHAPGREVFGERMGIEPYSGHYRLFACLFVCLFACLFVRMDIRFAARLCVIFVSNERFESTARK